MEEKKLLRKNVFKVKEIWNIVSVFPIVQVMHYERTVHAMTPVFTRLGSKTVKTREGVLCSVIEHGMAMAPFRFQAAQKNSASLRSSLWQFENINEIIPCSITEQCTPSNVLTVYEAA